MSGQWEDSLEGCGNFDNLSSDIQTLACQAFYNLDPDLPNPSLEQWVQDNGATAECCEAAGVPEPEGQPSPQAGTTTPSCNQLTPEWVDININEPVGLGYNVEEYCNWCGGNVKFKKTPQGFFYLIKFHNIKYK